MDFNVQHMIFFHKMDRLALKHCVEHQRELAAFRPKKFRPLWYANVDYVPPDAEVDLQMGNLFDDHGGYEPYVFEGDQEFLALDTSIEMEGEEEVEEEDDEDEEEMWASAVEGELELEEVEEDEERVSEVESNGWSDEYGVIVRIRSLLASFLSLFY